MKACVLEENNKITYTEIDTPQIKNNEVLVKVGACGICSSDFNRVYNNGAYFYPLVLGHEFSGTIVKTGTEISADYINKKVVVFPLLPCFECEFCKQKMYAQCKNYKYFGSRCNGAMAEYIAVPIWNIKVIPNDMDFSTAALAEPCAVAVHAVNKIENINEKNICISGSGAIGIMAGLIAKSKGANVCFALRNNKKVEFLKSLGFDNYITEDNNEEFDVVMECVGTNDSVTHCISLTKSKGQLILVGNPASDMHLDKKIYWKILRSEINVSGVWNSNYKNQEKDDWDSAIEFLYYNKIVSKLVTNKYKLKDGIEAFNSMKNSKEICLKGVFENEE